MDTNKRPDFQRIKQRLAGTSTHETPAEDGQTFVRSKVRPVREEPSRRATEDRNRYKVTILGIMAFVVGFVLIAIARVMSHQLSVAETVCKVQALFQGAESLKCFLGTNALDAYPILLILGVLSFIVGGVLLYVGFYTKSEARRYERVVEQEPDNPDAYIKRGNYFIRYKKYDDAFANFERAIELDPYNAVAYNNRGSVWKTKGYYKNAIADYKRAVALSPQNTLYRANLEKLITIFQEIGSLDTANIMRGDATDNIHKPVYRTDVQKLSRERTAPHGVGTRHLAVSRRVSVEAPSAITALRPYLGLFIMVPIILVVTAYYVFIPHRSIKAFCDTFQQEATSLHNKYDKQSQNIAAESQSDPLGGLISSAGSLIQMQGDLVTMFDRLDRVAPDQIEPDVAAVRNAFKQQAAATSQIASNPLGAVTSELISGLQSMGSVQNVNNYIKGNCNLSFMEKGNVSSTTTKNDVQALAAGFSEYLSNNDDIAPAS